LCVRKKVAVGIKLDSDVLNWFKGQGKGYQTRINSVLRRFYEVQQKSAPGRRDVRFDTLGDKKGSARIKAAKRK
jgi:BrnA antitoxin of type II toxin-antitoxin system